MSLIPMHHLLDDFVNRERDMFALFRDPFFAVADPSTGQRSVTSGPKTDIVERDDHYEVSVEAPGIPPENVSVEVKDGALHIRGERKEEKEVREGRWHRKERSTSSFSRSFSLPRDVNGDNVTAAANHGVLTITLPKVAVTAPMGRKIPVQTAEAGPSPKVN